MASKTATRFVGTCQICEREHKLHNGTIVHHGYKRPGDGEIHGDCFGVGHAPYETSCEQLKVYVALLTQDLEKAHDFLAQLTNGSVTELFVTHRDVSTWKNTTIKVTSDSPNWTTHIQSRIWGMQSKIRLLEGEQSRTTRRIQDWKPTTIKTFEEVLQNSLAATVAKLTERAEKKARQSAVLAAKKARREAREAKVAAERAAVVAELNRLAKEDKPSRAAVARIAKKAKKMEWHGPSKDMEDAAIELGIAEERPGMLVIYWKRTL